MNRDKQPVSACNMSVAQQEYVAREIRRHRQVTICRVMLLVLLLALWELAADMHWIDSFIFSSPVMIAKCLVSMAKDGSLFLHTGVTLMETLISFAVCTIFGLACALLLWSSKSVAQVLEPFLVLLNSLPKSALAPLLIVWLGNNMRTIVVAAVSVAVFGSILTLYTGFSQMDTEQIKLIYSLGGCALKGSAARFPAPGHQQYESKHRAVSGGCDYRGIPERKSRPGISDHLWLPDLCHDHGGDLHCDPLHCVRGAVPDYRLCGAED